MLSMKVEGLAEAQAALRRAGADAEQLKDVNKEAAGVVADASESTAPRRSGRLAGAHSAESTQRYGLVVVDVPYAGAIHFGWSTRGLGTGRTKQDLQAALGGAFSQRTLGKAARLAKVRTSRKTGVTRGAVRGGPIKPTPWIYEAGDRRADDVIGKYEGHMDAIADAFNGAG